MFCEDGPRFQEEIDELLDQDFQVVRISLICGIRRRKLTTVTGLPRSIDQNSLLKKLKLKLGCGGVIRKNTLELQGDHRKFIAEFLVDSRMVLKKNIQIS